MDATEKDFAQDSEIAKVSEALHALADRVADLEARLQPLERIDNLVHHLHSWAKG